MLLLGLNKCSQRSAVKLWRDEIMQWLQSPRSLLLCVKSWETLSSRQWPGVVVDKCHHTSVINDPACVFAIGGTNNCRHRRLKMLKTLVWENLVRNIWLKWTEEQYAGLMQSNAEPSKTEKRIKKVRAIFCQNACADFLKSLDEIGKQNARIREVTMTWKPRLEEKSIWSQELQSCGGTLAGKIMRYHRGTLEHGERGEFGFRLKVGTHQGGARSCQGGSGAEWKHVTRHTFWTPKDQFLQVIPMYTARPIRLKTPWPWRLAGTNWSNRVRFGQRSRRTSCFDVAYVILSEIHAWLCMLFAEVCFFDACAVLGTWPSPNKLHERFVLGVQVVLRKTQSRWHCSNPSTPARQTSGGRGWEPSLRTRNCASPLRIFAKRVGWCFFYAWPKFVTHTHTQRERTSPVPAAI